MRIVSIEPTPNPNNMKLNMDESLADGVQLSFSQEAQSGAPGYIKRLLAISGVKTVYQTADFIALGRHPSAPWPAILLEARRVFDQGRESGAAQPDFVDEAFGEVRVYVQMLRGIPMQVKLVSGTEEVRAGLPERFNKAAMQVAATSPDVLAERKWKEQGVRYGDLKEIGEDVAQQIATSYDEPRLQRLVQAALNRAPGETPPPETLSPAEAAARLDDPDWRKRYAALEQMDLTPEGVPVLVRAMADTHPSVRRLAVVCLGATEEAEVLPHLLRGLKDPSGAVRRAAGDCLSDRGAVEATGAMAEALTDPSKLVRWRAARFLYEVGDHSALPALRAAEDDPEFEVSLQVRLAIERIEGGHQAAGPVWQQMTRNLPRP